MDAKRRSRLLDIEGESYPTVEGEQVELPAEVESLPPGSLDYDLRERLQDIESILNQGHKAGSFLQQADEELKARLEEQAQRKRLQEISPEDQQRIHREFLKQWQRMGQPVKRAIG